MIIPSRHGRLATAVAIAALHYDRLGLILSHYDARAHLVVPRRVVDSLTPGWQQIGAVWLPLPHLLNVVPVQLDALYRSGASAVVLSVASFAIATAAIAWIVRVLTGSALAAVSGAAIFWLNPNVLYLQATPMTEPLLLATTTVAVATLLSCVAPDFSRASDDVSHASDGSARASDDDVGRASDGSARASDDVSRASDVSARASGIAFALACLTRYEAWPVTAAALLLAVLVLWRQGASWPDAAGAVARIAAYPVAAVAAFLIFSRVVIGTWFVPEGFFVPENTALGQPWLAAAEIAWGTHALSGSAILAVATVGLVSALVLGLAVRERAPGLLTLALLAGAAVPWTAFVKGHPFRIRYMVPLIAAEAVGAGLAAGLVYRFRAIGAMVILGIAVLNLRPLDVRAPMVVEARWDQPNVPVRQMVTTCLRSEYEGETIMASMGSLGHYMQEASREGFAIRDYLHEGNGDIWLAALDGPRPFVGWILIEEKANGGDMLAKRARENPRFLDGFSRVCEGAGLALYRRAATARGVRSFRTGHSP